MNPSYIGYFGSFGAGRVRRFLGVRLWLLVLVAVVILVVGFGFKNVEAVSLNDRCYHIKYTAGTGEDNNMNRLDAIPTERIETYYTNRVCADNEKIYAEKSDDATRFAVQNNHVCLLMENKVVECKLVEATNNNEASLAYALSAGMYDVARGRLNISLQEETLATVADVAPSKAEQEWSGDAAELTLAEDELNRYSGDSNLDSCSAVEYTYEGKTRYTNKLCVNSKGQLYSTTEGASENNLSFVANYSNWAEMKKGNQEHIGTTTWDGEMSIGDFAMLVWKNACSAGGLCNGYELTGETLTADRGSEEWSEVDQTTTEDPENKSAVCYKGSGALGWIMCPIIEGASGIGNYMWNQIEENHLKIPASEIFADNGGVYNGWEVVRNIANIAFVILFMVVIFSQLTGRGIDNYGIKKILPRLIVVAILMNMSYLICELAVDLSNIVGNGLNNLLSGLADGSGGLSDADTALSQANALDESSDFSQVTSWAAVAGLAFGGTALFLLLNPGTAFLGAASIGLAVLGLVITIVVAMLTLYLILVIREAGIVILIVLAPVAMVCYTLPNMDKWFKKWLDLGKALLIVYPLCGLAVGGGQLAGAILGTIPNQSMKIAAMIVQVLPFFLIPTLLRRSLSLMGNVGARVSNIGRNLGRRGSSRAQNAIQNSNRFKDFQKYQQERGAARRAQRISDRLHRVARDANGHENLNRLSENQRLRLLDADRAVNAQTQRAAEAQVGAYTLDENLAVNRAESSRNAQELKAYQDQFAGYSQQQLRAEANNAGDWLHQAGGAQRMSALLGAMESNGMENDMATMISRNDVGNMAGVMQTLASSKNKVFKAYGKRGAGVSYEDFMRGTMYRDADGNLTRDAMDAQGNANTSVSLRHYAEEKAGEFVDGLDDKALRQINTYSGAGNEIMSTRQLVDAAARMNSEDSLREVNDMLRNRGDIAGSFSGEQLLQFNDSTLNTLDNIMHYDPNVYATMERSADAIAQSPELIGKLSDTRREYINNNFRLPRGLNPI